MKQRRVQLGFHGGIIIVSARIVISPITIIIVVVVVEIQLVFPETPASHLQRVNRLPKSQQKLFSTLFIL